MRSLSGNRRRATNSSKPPTDLLLYYSPRLGIMPVRPIEFPIFCQQTLQKRNIQLAKRDSDALALRIKFVEGSIKKQAAWLARPEWIT